MKLGANYGPVIHETALAQQQGYHQLMWLNGDEITEFGSFNFFIHWNNKGKKELITPPLDGTVLPGITRESVIELLKPEGEIVQKQINIRDFAHLAKHGKVYEAFGT